MSSFGSDSGERGRAINPVRVDSRIPKGVINLRNESMRDGLADLLLRVNLTAPLNLPVKTPLAQSWVEWRQESFDLQFNDAVVATDIKHFPAELVRKSGDGIQVLVLVSQGLAKRQIAWMEVRMIQQ
jgi:hypothetical protein